MTTTPILDLEQDPPKPRRAVWRLLAWLAIGGVIGVAIVAVHLMILLHEASHLAAGGPIVSVVLMAENLRGIRPRDWTRSRLEAGQAPNGGA